MIRLSHYHPFGSRAKMYKGRKDPRKDKELIALLREERYRTGNIRAFQVKPGPQ